MPWFKSPFVYKKSSHLFTRLQLREEKAHAYRLIPWLALVNISFSIVDWFVIPDVSILEFILIRSFAVLISRVSYLLSRGRLKYGTRLLLTVGPYMWGVEYIMLKYDLLITPYFAGLSLVMVTSAMLFPVRTAVATVVYFVCVIPVFCFLAVEPLPVVIDNINVAFMALGTVLVCSVNSGQVFNDLKARLIAAETLARDLGKREKLIREKASELAKRQVFESQFSPQVVKSILSSGHASIDMGRRRIATIVIDIQDSTLKAQALEAEHYKQVVEEVLDVFSAACMKWDITIDKFTGDGMQAFSGAPVARPNDLERAVLACRDAIHMLQGRKFHLQTLWNDELNVRFAVSQGEALVGFVGKGIFKTYTAIGDVVSFTHRLSGVPEPWSIGVYVWSADGSPEISFPGFDRKVKQVNGLKGFGNKQFNVTILKSRDEFAQADAGRCTVCQTPMMLEEDKFGFPKIYCPACTNDSIIKKAA